MIQRERERRATEAALKAQEAATARQQQEARDLATFNANKAFLEGLKIPELLQRIIDEEELRNACVAWRENKLAFLEKMSVSNRMIERLYEQFACVALLHLDSCEGRDTPRYGIQVIEFLGNAEHGTLFVRDHTTRGFLAEGSMFTNFDGESRMDSFDNVMAFSKDQLVDPNKIEGLVAGKFVGLPGPFYLRSYFRWNGATPTGYDQSLSRLQDEKQKSLWARFLRR